MKVQLHHFAAMLVAWVTSIPTFAQSPVVKAISPQSNYSHALRHTDVSIQFSQAMATPTSSSGIAIYGSQTGFLTLPHKGNFSQPSSQEIVYSALTEFVAGEKITVVVTTKVKSNIGISLAKPMAYDFLTAAAPAPASFVPTAELSGIQAPQAVGTGDFDGDKDIDLIILTDEKAFIRLNNGKGSFSGTGSVLTDGSPRAVIATDIDRDGDVDLAIANNKGFQTQGSVSIRLNNGKGSFSGATNLKVGLDPISLKVVDLNGDGFLDIAALNAGLGDPYEEDGTGSVSILLNDGMGTFTNSSEVKVGYNPNDIQLADFDGDGDMDLATADIYETNDPSSGSVSVSLNNGKGGFAARTAVVFGYNVYAIQTGDFDGDGDADILSGGTNIDGPYSYLTVLTNAGKGSFTKKAIVVPDFLSRFKDVRVADYDGDGDLDAAAVATASSAIALFLNDEQGTFTYHKSTTTSSEPINILPMDVDGNGTMDLACVQTGKVTILQNRFFVQVQIPTSYLCTKSTLALPFKVNGKLSAANVFTAQLSNAAGSFSNPTPIGSLQGNESGTMPVVIPSTVATGSAYRVRIVASEGNFPKEDNGTNLQLYTDCPAITSITPTANSLNASVSTNIAMTFSQVVSSSSASGTAISIHGSQTGSRTVHPGGFSGGGTNKLVFNPSTDFHSSENVSVTISKNTKGATGTPLEKPWVYEFTAATTHSSGSFKTASTLTMSGNPYAICSADLDGDGDLDIATANLESDQVAIRYNDGKGNMSGTDSLTVGIRPVHILTADFDNDGDMDIATTSAAANSTSIRFNDGKGHFTGSTEIVTDGGPTFASVADIDADGDLDIAIANYFSTTVSIRLNNGAGQFSGNGEIATGDSPATLHFADIDADGDMDLLSATENSFDDHVWVSLNNGTGHFSNTYSLLNASSRAIKASDLDADGDVDLIISTGNGVALLSNSGDGTFSNTTNLAAGNFISTADFDGDKDVDLLIIDNFTSPYKAKLYLNTGGKGVFATPRETSLAFEPIFICASDLNGDGSVDIALANGYNNNLSFLFNQPLATNNCAASGSILQETWESVQGYSAAQVPIKTAPTARRQLNNFEGLSDIADNYGDRISGYICPPQSGNYTFWISGDDYSALFLSKDDLPAHKVRIAYVNGYTQRRQWNKFSTQQSAPVYLEAGKRYYIESLHKEATGRDHIAVGWQLPDGQLERPIAGKRLSPFTPFNARLDETAGLQSGLPFLAWPNPFSDHLTVGFTTHEAGNVRLELYDLQGKLVQLLLDAPSAANATQQVNLDVQSLKPGLYLMRLVNGGHIEQQKVLLQR